MRASRQCRSHQLALAVWGWIVCSGFASAQQLAHTPVEVGANLPSHVAKFPPGAFQETGPDFTAHESVRFARRAHVDSAPRGRRMGGSGTPSGSNADAGGGTGSGGPGGPVSGNPAATDILAGTGLAGQLLGIDRYGWRLGGFNISGFNGQLSGGLAPGKWTGQSLTVVDFSVDVEKYCGWPGGRFAGQFLYYSGGSVNDNAGTVMGYNSLDSVAPRTRAELYQLWYHQKLCDDNLSIRIGKSVPTFDFNNVTRSLHFNDGAYNIAALSSAILTPLYISPTQLGILPGYYNSAFGISSSVNLPMGTYAQYGWFDGNLAAGRQTGLQGPHFNGYYLHLFETGAEWEVGALQKPGKFGMGYWLQSGQLEAASGTVDGAEGLYLFASQRLYYEKPGQTNEGMSAYVQLAATNSAFIETHRYFGCGLTYFGPLACRDRDALGFALAYGKMNDDPALGLGSEEWIYTWYYQVQVCSNCYFQPNLTFIDDPAQSPGTKDAVAVSCAAIVLF